MKFALPSLTSKDAGSQQIGFLLGSCGVAVALTSDACHKGLLKNTSGDIMQFKGQRGHFTFPQISIMAHTFKYEYKCVCVFRMAKVALGVE